MATKFWGRLYAGTAVVAILAGNDTRAQTFTISPGTTQTVSTSIGASNTVTVTGGGTLALTNASNAYKGGTFVLDGSTVEVSTDTDLGNANVSAVTLGDATKPGTLELTNTVAVGSVRAITLAPGGGIISAFGTSLWTFGGVVSGTGPLTIDGTGSVALTGTNTYSSGVSVIGGATLHVNADTNLGAATGGITLGDNVTTGTLAMGSGSPIASARNVTLGNAGGTIETDTLAPNSASTWDFTGIVSGSGPLTIAGNQTVVLDGIETYTGLTTVEHGDLRVGDAKTPTASLPGDVVVSGSTLSGHGTILGLVTNSGGTVAPGSGGIGPLTVGTFSQGSGGTLTIELSPSGVSELNVTGAATLGGTLHLEFAPGYYKSGVYQLESASSITGTFSSITGNIGVGFSQDVSIGSTFVDLTLAKLAVLPEDPTLYPAVTSVLVEGAQQANSALVSRLSDVRAAALVDDLRIGRYPEHVDGSAPGSSAYGAWARGSGGFGSTSSSGGTPGYDVRGGGIIAGVDEAINSGSGAAGFAVSYTIDSLSEHGRATATINEPQLGFYGGYWFGRLALDGSLGFGLPRVDGTRPLSAGQTPKSSFNGTDVTTAFQGSLPFHRGAWVFTPAVGMDYAYVFENAFSESGSTLDINGHSTGTNSLQPFISASVLTRIETPSGMAIEPGLKATYAYEALGTSRNLAFQPPNDASVFVAEGIAPSRSTVGVDGSLTFEVSRALAFGADAGWSHNGTAKTATFDASLRYRF